MSKFIVSKHPETGLLINPSKKSPGWFQCQLMVAGTLNLTTGIANKRTVLIKARDEAILESIIADVKAGAYNHLQIQRRLSRTPFYEGQPEVMNPETQETVMFEGAPYYQQTCLAPATDPSDIWVNPVPEEAVVAEAAKSFV